VSDDTGGFDPSEWLSKQFDPKGEAKKPERGEPTADSATPDPAVTGAVAAEEPPAQGGGFDWGLGGAAAVPPAPGAPAQPIVPPAADPVAPPELIVPPPPEPPAPDTALWGAPAREAEPPTVALPWESAPEPVATEPPTELLGTPDLPAPTELLRTPEPSAPTELLAAQTGAADAAIDSLFGEAAFKDYEGESVLASSPFGAGSGNGGAPRPPRAKGGPLPRNQRIMIWVAGSLVAVLALVVLFVVGTRLPTLLGPSAVATATPTHTATPTPTPTTALVGPVAVGVHEWSDLRGGECLDPFTSVWAEKFTVVDCTTPHAAQMVFRGTFPATAAIPSTATPAPTTTPDPDGYPGLAALQAQINLLCTAPGVIDLAVAGAYSDIQFQAAYAADAAEWKSGQHDYFCFVSRSSGQPLTNSVATPPAAG
jgi:hypothetical protein